MKIYWSKIAKSAIKHKIRKLRWHATLNFGEIMESEWNQIFFFFVTWYGFVIDFGNFVMTGSTK
jgi:hypothetical protein